METGNQERRQTNLNALRDAVESPQLGNVAEWRDGSDNLNAG